MTETKHGWHFLPADGRVPRTGTLIGVGTVERHDEPLRMCQSGLHFSERIIDSLSYAPGPILHEVTVSGMILMDIDKGVASIRETLWVADVTAMLHAFARWCAWSVRDKWGPPPIVLKYLSKGLEADRAAAWAAARATQDATLVSMLAEFRAGKREWVLSA